MAIKPTILFAFANDTAESLQLKEELKKTYESHLVPLKNEGIINLPEPLRFKKPDDLISQLQNRNEKYSIFHFAGHSSAGGIDSEQQLFPKELLALLLTGQNTLRLVFLNGCDNAEQVQALHDAGVPVVIATTEEIADTAAIDFSRRFYEALSFGRNINDSFIIAVLGAKLSENKLVAEQRKYRGFGPRRVKEKSKFPWGVYVKEGEDKAMDWRIKNEVDGKLVAQFRLLFKEINAAYLFYFKTDPSKFYGKVATLVRYWNSNKHRLGSFAAEVIDTWVSSTWSAESDLEIILFSVEYVKIPEEFK